MSSSDSKVPDIQIDPPQDNGPPPSYVEVTLEDKDAVIMNGKQAYETIQEDEGSSDTLQEIPLHVERIVYTQPHFDELYQNGPRYSKTIRERGQELKESCACSAQCTKNFFLGIFPFIRIMKAYQIPDDLINDLISGLTVCVMHIPQGMAYAQLADVDPVYGLYVSFFPVILYFFFGTSKHISMGTFAVICLMVGTAVNKYYTQVICPGETAPVATTASPFTTIGFTDMYGNTTVATATASCDKRILTAMAVCFLVGLIQLGLGILQLGFVTIYLSDPFTRGFTTGASMHVFTSQIKHVFGISVQRYSGWFKLPKTYIDLFSKMGSINWAAIIISCSFIIVIYLVKEYLNPPVKKRIKMPIPIELVAVIVGTLLSYGMDLKNNYGLTIVGKIPMGFPTPTFPPTNLFSSVIVDSIAIAIVAFAISVAMSKLFAKKHNYEIDANQELIAYGIVNALSSVFHCFVATASLSRSLVQENVGGRTQFAGMVSSALMLIVILTLGFLFEPLPNAVLAAIIIVALKGMFMQFKDICKLFKLDLCDLSVWIVTYAAVTLSDVDVGLIIGVLYSFLTVTFRTQRPYVPTIGNIPDTELYKDVSTYPAAEQTEGVVIIRFENNLYYANCEHFIDKAFKRAGVDPRSLKIRQVKVQKKKDSAEKKIKKLEEKLEKSGPDPKIDSTIQELKAYIPTLIKPEPPLTDMILDLSSLGYLDSMGCGFIVTLVNDFKAVSVNIYITGCKAGIREKLEKCGVHEKLSKEHVFLTLHDAVLFVKNDRMEKNLSSKMSQKLNVHEEKTEL